MAAATRISLGSYTGRNDPNVVRALHDVGLWHVSPCTDVGFKYVFKGQNRAVRFIESFCDLLDACNHPLCLMLDGKRILERRKVGQIEVVPESIGYKGEVVTKKTGGKKGKKIESPESSEKADELPEHPKIDSGFIVRLSDENIFKIGIEMQVRDKDNMPARMVDYGIRVFRYKGEGGDVGSKYKVFELSLNRWGIASDANKLLSISGREGGECDAQVGENLVSAVCLCCVSVFLGKSVNIMDEILNFLRKKYPNGAENLQDDDKTHLQALVQRSMKAERDILSQQVTSLTREGLATMNYMAWRSVLSTELGF